MATEPLLVTHLMGLQEESAAPAPFTRNMGGIGTPVRP